MATTMREFNIRKSPVYRYFKDIRNEKVFDLEIETTPGGSTITLKGWEEGFLLRFKALVVDGLETEGYDVEPTTRNALKLLISEFQRVSLFRNNLMRVGRRNAFYDYLMGIPGIINFPFMYYDQFELLKEWTGVDLRDVKKRSGEDYFYGSDISEFFVWHIEKAVNDLLKEHGLPKLDDLKILD